ncbi:MAG: helix-turn-helix transcriptional regulator [Clostridia bacterium]|nr:helix-turn-helix transcriptional regulator [Clostridia bacterium]
MTTGEKIKYLREKKGITQDDLAKAAGYKDRSSIAKIESGGSDPSQRMLLKIATVLEVSPAELLEDTTTISDPAPNLPGAVKLLSLAHAYPNMSPQMRAYVDGSLDFLFRQLDDQFKKGSTDDDTKP